jgi:hypothetical protein
VVPLSTVDCPYSSTTLPLSLSLYTQNHLSPLALTSPSRSSPSLWRRKPLPRVSQQLLPSRNHRSWQPPTLYALFPRSVSIPSSSILCFLLRQYIASPCYRARDASSGLVIVISITDPALSSCYSLILHARFSSSPPYSL